MSLASAFNAMTALAGASTDSRWQKIDRAIKDGLPAERARLGMAKMIQAYYDLNGIQYIPKRDAESDPDYQRRPKRTFPFTRRVVNILCSHLYNPGPSRSLGEDSPADEWLQGVYRDNLINVLMQQADRLATLQGISAVQVAATGDPDRPIKLQLWGEDQLAFFTSEDATTITDVVTITEFDETRTFTWWSADQYRTYRTKRPGTTGGRTADFVPDMSGDNPYGVLPFAFIHNELPVNHYMTPGLGEYLANFNGTIDVEASDLAQAMQAYHRPWGFVYDAEADWQPIHKMGSFIRMNTRATDMERSNPPRVEFVQPDLDIDGGWNNIRQAIDTALECLGVPSSLYRLNQSTLPSGAALIAEQQPIIDYSRSRQVPFERYETELARVILTVGGTYYEMQDLLDAAADVKLSLTWPPVTIRTPGSEQDMQDQNSVGSGYESTAMVVKRRLGLSSDEQVWEHLEQVAEDEAKLATIKYQPEMEDMSNGEVQPEAEGAEAEGEVSDDESIDGTDA